MYMRANEAAQEFQACLAQMEADVLGGPAGGTKQAPSFWTPERRELVIGGTGVGEAGGGGRRWKERGERAMGHGGREGGIGRARGEGWRMG